MKQLMSKIICKKLEDVFSPSKLEIVDESNQHVGHAGAREGGESHFAVTIISSKFAGLSRVARHKLVYAALENELKTQVHALKISAIAPQERQN